MAAPKAATGQNMADGNGVVDGRYLGASSLNKASRDYARKRVWLLLLLVSLLDLSVPVPLRCLKHLTTD